MSGLGPSHTWIALGCPGVSAYMQLCPDIQWRPALACPLPRWASELCLQPQGEARGGGWVRTVASLEP